MSTLAQRRAICNAHIAFLEDCKIRYTSETHNVHSNEFRRYVDLVVPTGMNEPWKVVELVKMGKREVSIFRLINDYLDIPTALIVAPHSNPESGYWVYYPSKTLGGDTVRPIHLLDGQSRKTAISQLHHCLEYLAAACNMRERERKGLVGTNDDGPIEIVKNPAKPDAVTPLGPCTVDEFFVKLGYLSIEEDEEKQGRVVAIANTKWDERLYSTFKKIFNDPLPVVFTHGNLVPENVLCNADGSICEIIGWERAGWLPQGWEGAAALRDRGSPNASWHDVGTRAVEVLDRSRAWGAPQPTCDLWKLENARLNGRLAPHSWREYGRLVPHSWREYGASRTKHCKDQAQSIRRIREFSEKVRVQSGDEGLIASDGEVPTVLTQALIITITVRIEAWSRRR